MNMLTSPPSPGQLEAGTGSENGSDRSSSQYSSEALACEAPALAAALGILSDFLQKSSCDPGELPGILHSLHETCLAAMREENNAGKERLSGFLQRRDVSSPAVPVEDSYTDQYIICLEDGKKVKALSRYLRSYYGMTMEEYRLRWNLPDDYPAIPPALSRRRAEVARENKPHFSRANVLRPRATAAFSGSARNDFSNNNITTLLQEG